MHLKESIYEKLLLYYMGNEKKRAKYSVDVKSVIDEYNNLYLSATMFFYDDESATMAIPINKIKYEYNEKKDLINQFNIELVRVYKIHKPYDQPMYVSLCVKCDSIYMGAGLKRAYKKNCFECIKKEVEVNHSVGVGFKEKSFVYLMKSELTGLLKIGTSQNPKSRKRSLETAQGGSIDILNLLHGGGKLERVLHARFDNYRQQGEWFLPSDEIIDYFHELREIEEGKNG